MKQTYKIGGMSCGSCVAKVQAALQAVDEVSNAQVDKAKESAELRLDSAVPLTTLKKALADLDPKYSISNSGNTIAADHTETETKSWIASYRPIFLVFFFILLVTLLIQYTAGQFNTKEWMRHFMAGFFLVFSFFKMLDLKGFAMSYMSYDIIAKRWKSWGYVYAFIELGLGVAYLLDCCPLATNSTAFVVMSISIIGVLESVLNNRKIQCACLGAVFELPMSTVTIIEDALMILMSGYMILGLLGA